MPQEEEKEIIRLLTQIRDTLWVKFGKPREPVPEHEHVWKDVSYGVGDINKDTVCSVCGISKY